MSIPSYQDPGPDPISENLVTEKRRPPMMFINSGFAGGGSKHGHFHRVQKSKSYLSDDDPGSNHLYVPKNTKLIEEDGIPFPQLNVQMIHQGLKTIKDSHMVSIQALIKQLKMFVFSGKVWIMDIQRL